MEYVDIDITPDKDGVFDISVDPETGDLSLTRGLDTALDVSLFSDARADASQVQAPQHRRGWLGDVASTVEDRKYGSLLWLIQQRRLTTRTVNEVIDYSRGALRWIVEDGLAQSVNVSAQIRREPSPHIELSIVILTNDGETLNRFIPLWRNTTNAT